MAAEPTPSGFGGKLREARERKGISLRQIANTTKISISALEALERNDIARLPGGIFSRAFVRAYAIEVGLEPEATIQDFIAQFPHDSVTAGHPTSEQIEDNQTLESDRRMASTFLRLVGISVPIAGVVLYYGLAGSRGPTVPVEPATQAGGATAVAEAAPSPARPEPAPPPVAVSQTPVSVPSPSVDRLTVGLSATGPCWVSAIVDGQQAIARQLEAGERQVLEVRRELVLTAGDAAALDLTLNGANARTLGKPGKVVTIRLNLTNFKEYLVTQ